MHARFRDTFARLLTIVSGISFLISSLALAQDSSRYYDEVFDERGEVRPHYREVWNVYRSMSESEREAFAVRSKELFSGDVAVDPLPRILLDSEFETLRKGVIQRGSALRKFAEDYYGGGDRWKTVIPANVLARIVDRTHESGFFGKVNPRRIAFPYGPDIIRDPDGIWRVLEDNIGNIGGPGDIELGRDALFKLIPQYRSSLAAIDDPARFFKELTSRFARQAYPHAGKIVLYTLAKSEEADLEVERIRQGFEANQVEWVAMHSNDKKLRVEPDGVYLEKKAPNGAVTRDRVSFLIMSGDPMHVDSAHPAAYLGFLQENVAIQLELLSLAENGSRSESVARPMRPEEILLRDKLSQIPRASRNALVDKLRAALERSHEAGDLSAATARLEAVLRESPIHNAVARDLQARDTGILNAILEGKVFSNYTPGLDFMGDKEFNAYVDDLVRLYLNEEPILRSIESKSFGYVNEKGETVVDAELVNEVFSNKDRYVVKVVDGRGGDGIWVGPKTTHDEFVTKAKAAVLNDPVRYRAQAFKHPSVMAGERIVDLRLLSQVDSKGVSVGETPFGRTISIHGDGKVNVSSHGYESSVATVRSNVAEAKARMAKAPTVRPSVDARWDRVSRRLHERYGITLRFKKRLERSAGLAYYSDKDSSITITESARKLGPEDSGFLHEMLHAFEHWRFKQGVQSPLHIAFFNTAPMRAGRGKNVVDELYHDYLGADELAAYAYSNSLVAREEFGPGMSRSVKDPHDQAESLGVLLEEMKAELDIADAILRKSEAALAALKNDPAALIYSVDKVFPDAGDLLVRVSASEFVGIPVANYVMQKQIKRWVTSKGLSDSEQAELDAQARYLAKDQLLRLIDLVREKQPLLSKHYRAVTRMFARVRRGEGLSEADRKEILKRVAESRSRDLHYSSRAFAPVKADTAEELEREKEILTGFLDRLKKNRRNLCSEALRPQGTESFGLDDVEMQALMKVIFKK